MNHWQLLFEQARRAWQMALGIGVAAFVVTGLSHYLAVEESAKQQSLQTTVAQQRSEHKELQDTDREIVRNKDVYARYQKQGLIGEPQREAWHEAIARTAQTFPLYGDFVWEILQPKPLEFPSVPVTGAKVSAHDLVLKWNNVLEEEPLAFIQRLEKNMPGVFLWQALTYVQGGVDGAYAEAKLRFLSIEKHSNEKTDDPSSSGGG